MMPLQPLLMLVVSVGGCRAFTPVYHRQLHQQHRHDWRRRPTHQRPPPWPRETSLSLHKERSEFQSVYAVAAASFVFVGSSFILADQTASAIDTQSFNMLQHKEQVVSRSGNSIEVAFQGFIWKGSTLRTKLTDLPTLLNSDKSTAITKEMSAEQLSDADINDANFVRFDELPHAKPQTMSLVDKKSIPTAVSSRTTSIKPKKGELKATDVKKIAKENRIEVELDLKDDKRPLDVSALKPPTIVKIDRETWNKVRIVQPPFLPFLPSSVQPLVSRQFSLQVLKEIPNNQLFVASVLAGSLTEMIRTSLLYPLSTVKARVQARRARTANRKRTLSRKLRISWLTFLHEAKRGDWYAGILPTILITVPASGVYQGAKEVSRRALSMTIQYQMIQSIIPGDDATSTYFSALVVNLCAAFVADIAALTIRTPADVLSLRLQVFGSSNVRSDFTSWVKDSLLLLPSMIKTDVPFLLSRIFLNAAVTTSGENLGRYEVETIGVGEYKQIVYIFS